MEWHIHRPLLQMTAEAILARHTNGKHTHLLKVSAHSGVVGNEMADELAKAASGEPEADANNNGETKVCPAPSSTPMHELYWPVYETQAATPDEAAQILHVQDLKRSLKKHLHHTSRLGYAKQDEINFSAWQAIVPVADGAGSNGFLNLPKGIDSDTRKLVLQARYGTLNTAKFRMRCGIAPSNACLLCGAPDGGHHSLSRCDHMMGMYTRRHTRRGALYTAPLRRVD
jgi:hypothetical protein